MNNKSSSIAKITCEVHKSIASMVIESLKKHNVEHVYLHSRRALVLREKSTLPFLPPSTGIDEDPAETYEIYVPWSNRENILKTIVKDMKLNVPGRGTIYAEEVKLLAQDSVNPTNMHLANIDMANEEVLLEKLACISCVVGRGRGNDLAMYALESGTNVPTISYGVGTGLRNKLGLIRITIPAEKEMVNLLISEHDCDEIMNSLIEAGQLDQPGRGFIGTFPVALGVINSKIFRGKQRHSASMEQIIAAIDHLKANTAWRKRDVAGDASVYLKKTYLRDLVNMTLICNEGKSSDLAAAAMSAGAGGATISKIKYVSLGSNKIAVSPARESISMGISPKAIDMIIQAMEAIGAFGTEIACTIETKPLPKACTYLGK